MGQVGVKAASPELPRLAYLALGGTIAGAPRDGDSGGVAPGVSASELVAAVPQIGQIARIQAEQFRQLSSSQLQLDDVAALISRLQSLATEGYAGFVVSQGTDSLEEVAFALDQWWDRPEPIVLTGAMRNPTLASADGAGNLLAAVRVAAAPQATDLGVLVVLNDRIHSARWVQKRHTFALDAFASLPTGPLGWVSEGRVTIAAKPAVATPRIGPPLTEFPRVALLRLSLGDDGYLLRLIDPTAYGGVVVEAFGGGHVPESYIAPLEALAQHIPVVLTSRIGHGPTLSRTYEYPGSEADLLRRGLLRATNLDGVKARMLLMMSLAAGESRQQLASRLAEFQ